MVYIYIILMTFYQLAPFRCIKNICIKHMCERIYKQRYYHFEQHVVMDSIISRENFNNSSTFPFVPSLIVSSIVFAWDIFALIIMHRSRGTPPFVKFLSSGLIIFEVLASVSFVVRKFIPRNAQILFSFTSRVALTGSILAYITVGVMSADRCFLVSSPLKYHKYSVLLPSRKHGLC